MLRDRGEAGRCRSVEFVARRFSLTARGSAARGQRPGPLPEETATPVHRLVPIDPNDPNWRASTHRGGAVVPAASVAQARSSAAEAFDAALARSRPGGKVATPLWRHAHAVRAEVVQDPRYRSEGPPGIIEPWGGG